MTGGQNSPVISFISYGNDKYESSKKRIIEEANAMGCFNGKIRMYSPSDLSNDFKSKTSPYINEDRGGGYWLWKSYICNDMINSINDNEYLLYTDTGCVLQKSGLPRLYEYIKMISPESGKSVLAMRLEGLLSKYWTTNAIFKHFNIPRDSEIGNSGQILAGVLLFRKCKESIEIIRKWLDVAQTKPDLFSDKYNNESKNIHNNFKDNRHDQGVLNVILQMDPYKNTVEVIKEEIEAYDTTHPIYAARKK
jgi:hypothetical protein